MDQVLAVEKHECPACGAQAEWNPAKQKLVCPFCGTESPYQIDRDTGKVAEQDLARALRELPDEARGWQTERRSVQCQSCKAVMVFDPARVGQNCEFCGSPALVSYEEIKAPISPTGVLPFRIDAASVRDSIRRWWRSKWLAPGKLWRTALVDTVKSLYIPYWTFDAQVHCPWDAEAGHYYYVPVTVTNGKGQRVTRMERRVRWEPASGVVDHFFDDEPVPGTQGLPLDLLKQVEPFPTPELRALRHRLPVGPRGRALPRRALRRRAALHRSDDRDAAAALRQQIPGDTYRNLRIFPQFSGRTFKHVLVPIWLLSYTYGASAFQVIVNGYTRPHRRPLPEEHLEDRAARAAGGARGDRRDRCSAPRPTLERRRRCGVLRVWLRSAPDAQRPQQGHELVVIDRLHEMAIETRGAGSIAILLLAPPGERQQHHSARPMAAAGSGGTPRSRRARGSPMSSSTTSGRWRRRGLERGRAIVRCDDVMPVQFEQHGERGRRIPIVVDHQDPA